MNKLELSYFGDKYVFEYSYPEEVCLTLNDADPAVLGRDEVVELLGFLSEFVEQFWLEQGEE